MPKPTWPPPPGSPEFRELDAARKRDFRKARKAAGRPVPSGSRSKTSGGQRTQRLRNDRFQARNSLATAFIATIRLAVNMAGQGALTPLATLLATLSAATQRETHNSHASI